MRILLGLLLITATHLNAQQFIDVAQVLGIQNIPMSDTHGSGISIIDFDNDGDLDFYLCTAKGNRDQLYEFRDGQYFEVSNEYNLNNDKRSRMALWLDYNSDGKNDLIVAGDCDFDEDDCKEAQNIRFYEQKEQSFIEVTNEVGLAGFGPNLNNQTLGGMASGDLNLDGYVDFILTVRNGPLLVFINNEGEFFEEQSQKLGFNINNQKYYQPLIADLNQDSWPDVYCNIDFGKNMLYENQITFFRERSISTRSDNSFNEMGIAYSDFDRDGDIDLYSTNIENYLGSDVHNILLRNELQTGNFYFEEVGKEFGVDQGGWGWGATFIDADNDGWQDLATTNGWDLPFEVIDKSKIWKNNEGYQFIDQSDNWGLSDTLNAATLLNYDYDSDGDLDLIQSIKGENSNQAVRILQNQLNSNNGFLSLNLKMGGNNKFAIGAIATIYQKGQSNSNFIISGSSFYGQEPNELFFGLGNSQIIDSLRVLWPGGTAQNYYEIDPNQKLTIDDSEILHTPHNLRGVPESSGVRLTWLDQNFQCEYYEIQRSLTPDFENVEIIISLANDKSIIDSTAKANKIYYYRLRAVNEIKGIKSSFSKSIEQPTIIVSDKDWDMQKKKYSIYPSVLSGGHNELKIEGLRQGIEPEIQIMNLNGGYIANFSIEQLNQFHLMKLFFDNPGVYVLMINHETHRIIVY